MKKSREDVQQLRSLSDAIMVGSKTIIQDNPRLNVRDASKWQPKRIVIDSRASISPTSKIFTVNGGEIIIITTDLANADKIKALTDVGAKVIETKNQDNKVNLKETVSLLGKEGISSILCESGGELSGGLNDAGLINKVVAYICPKICGGKDAHTPVEGRGINAMSDACQLSNLTYQQIESDLKITGRVKSWDWL